MDDISDLRVLSEIREQMEEMGPSHMPETTSSIHERILKLVKILLNFSKYREPEFTRSDYISQLKKDLCSYYGYNDELLEEFFGFMSIPETIEYLDASESQRPVTLRVNSLKIGTKQLGQMLMARGIDIDVVEGKWAKNLIKIYNTAVPIGATPEYLAGYYILQNPASVLPVLALAPKGGETILDMAAAPGVKTTLIAESMKNTGVIYANDSSGPRIKSLVSNIHRLGVRNSIVSNHDGRDLPRIVHNCDRVLLDAPCTGTGVISKDPSVKTKRGILDIRRSAILQKELILAAVDCLKVGGTLVYSTCSVLPSENEDVVNYCLQKRFVKIVPTNIHFGVKGFTKVRGKRFHPSLVNSKRFYPHTHNIDGFFVCKMVKFEKGERMNERVAERKKRIELKEQSRKRVLKKNNLESQKKREAHNKQLFQQALRDCGGDVEEARNVMEERKKKIMGIRKKFKSKKKAPKKWRKTRQ